MRLPIIHGKIGPSRRTERPIIACQGARAAGARVRICPGSRCVRSWWSKLRMIICKATDSVTRRSFADGGPIKNRRTAHMNSSKSLHRKNCKRFSRPGASAVVLGYVKDQSERFQTGVGLAKKKFPSLSKRGIDSAQDFV